MSEAPRLQFDMTVETFLDWCPEDGQRWQLVDGEPVAMAPARIGHGALQLELGGRLAQYLAAERPDCRAIAAPGVVPRIRAGKNLRVPDIAVTCSPLVADDRTLRNPVLLVEILSPSNTRDTWANVWAYTTIPSVREILVLHTRQRRADLLLRGPDGGWPEEALQVTDGELVLHSIGFRTALNTLYDRAGLARAE